MEFLRTLAGIRTPFFDTVFGLITRLGEEIVVMIVLCLLYWCINKNMATIIGISYFLSGLLMQGLKISFRVERPWVLDKSFQPVASAVTHATGYSFPSGHTQSATALFGSLGLTVKNKWAKVLCFFIMILVGFSRMYLGVHTPLDVAVGMALSLLIAYLALRFLVVDTYVKKRELTVMLALFLIAAGLFALGIILLRGGAITDSYTTDCCKAAGAGVGFAVGMYIERTYIRFKTSCKTVWMQALKFALGFAGMLLIKEGLKLVVETSLGMDMFRYFLMVFWAICLFPIIIKKVFEPKQA